MVGAPWSHPSIPCPARQTSGVEPEGEIVCVDCGGRCFLITPAREDGRWFPGDVVAYRCQDCRDRWDLVLPDDDAENGTEKAWP